MWLRLKTTQHLRVRGERKTYRPGDWVDAPNQLARQWLAQGAADIPGGNAQELIPANSGIWQRGGNITTDTRRFRYFELPVSEGDALPFSYTIVWDGAVPLQDHLIPMGLTLLTTWQVAVPLHPYEQLASTVGAAADRERTKDVIGDLRVPTYNPGLMFIRRCPEGDQLVKQFDQERGDPRLRFLRALFKVKPLILALPVTWQERGDRYAQ